MDGVSGRCDGGWCRETSLSHITGRWWVGGEGRASVEKGTKGKLNEGRFSGIHGFCWPARAVWWAGLGCCERVSQLLRNTVHRVSGHNGRAWSDGADQGTPRHCVASPGPHPR